MKFSDWRLDKLVARVRLEFSLEDNPENNEKIIEHLNSAIYYIARQKRGWRWSLKSLFIDVPDSTAIQATVTQGSRNCVAAIAVANPLRAFLVAGATRYGTRGYMITSAEPRSDGSGESDVVFESQYRGASGTIQATLQAGYFQLPEDFAGMETIHDLRTVEGEVMRPVSNEAFLDAQNLQQLSVGTEYIFSVFPDPLGLEQNWYLAVYPFLSTLTTLRMQYYRTPPALVDNEDTPILPVAFRPAILQLTYWKFAVATGYQDRVPDYRNTALEDIKTLIDNDVYVDKVGPSERSSIVLDTSAIRDIYEPGTADYNPGMI